MNRRDGRHDSDDMNDADWLLSQLGSGRRPDLEGRQAPQPPVAPPQQPAEPVSPPPMERPRRRSEESLDWFSLADAQSETDAATRELPVVGEPLPPRAEPPRQAPAPTWEPQAPAWNQPPGWDDRRPPATPREPQRPDDRLTSVEPPVGGAPVPPAFGGPQAPPPGPPPGPVTPPSNFALTWGEQPIETEDGLRAAFRQLSDPVEPPPQRPRDDRRPVEPHRDEPPVDPRDVPGSADSPFAGFTPPPVARQSFTPVTPPAGTAFPAARTDFDDQLWSALNEDPAAAGAATRDDRVPASDDGRGYSDDGRGYSDEQAYADASGQYDDHEFDQPGYDPRAHEPQGWDQQAYDQQGSDTRAYDQQGYDQRAAAEPVQDEQAYAQQGWDQRTPGEHAYDDQQGWDDQRAAGERVPDVPAYDQQGWDPQDRDHQGSHRDGWGRQEYDREARYDEPRSEQPAYDEQDGSPMAREMAQAGYFWNLTPDPTAPDPKAPVEDDRPGPRRRGASDSDAAPGGRSRDDRDARPGDDDRSAEPYPAVDQWDPIPDGVADDADVPSDPREAEYGDRDHRDDREYRDDREFRDDLEYRDDREYRDPRDEWSDAPYDRDDRRDPRGDRARGFAYDGPHDRDAVDDESDDDGLASLFGGAGFGATAPTPLVGGAAAQRDRDVDPYDARDDRYARDDDRYARDDRYGAYARDDRYGRDDDRYDRYGRDDDRYARDDRGGRGGPAAPRTRDDDDDRGGRSPVKLLAWIAGGLAAVLLVVAGIAFGAQLLRGGGDETADGGAGGATEPTAMQPPGTYAWNELFGGECLEPFEGPWAEEFTVIDCATPHAAQLVLRGEVSADESAPFPGEAELAAQVAALCGAENVIDPDMAAMAGDLQVEGSYPVTEEQWAAGERDFYCFVTRRGGSPITADVQGTAGQQG
ncbi:septum formation family protein [Agromyces indicus]|uniref:Septum formation family protein n=1 Tax=Agromyces indicus TaxID=758919 RepID=A0ABU1FML4_9MICO|nr:septum formation family protein [Agromyces indicus]MDR5692995.1 septum formation family protein [Agromyces indicus]